MQIARITAVATLAAGLALGLACLPSEVIPTEKPKPTETEDTNRDGSGIIQRGADDLRTSIAASRQTTGTGVPLKGMENPPRETLQHPAESIGTAKIPPTARAEAKKEQPSWRMPDSTQTGKPSRADVVKLIYQWLGEDPGRAKRETADRLIQLNTYTPTLALQLLGMPFMATHEPRDTGTVAALAYISITSPETAEGIASHPSLEGGITDDRTHAVALTYAERFYSHNITRTLEQEQLYTWTAMGTLPLSGPVSVTIASGASVGAEELAGSILESLTWLEDYLDTPMPTANVLVHYGASLPAGAKGGNMQVSISHLAGQAQASQFHWTRHELTHYWFSGNEGWLDEGLAQVLTSLMEGTGTGTPRPRSPECGTGERIVDTIGATARNELAGWCTYGLGERFMLTLLNDAGPEAFREGVRELAKTGQERAYPPLRIKDVAEAFSHHPQSVERARNRWYDRPG